MRILLSIVAVLAFFGFFALLGTAAAFLFPPCCHGCGREFEDREHVYRRYLRSYCERCWWATRDLRGV